MVCLVRDCFGVFFLQIDGAYLKLGLPNSLSGSRGASPPGLSRQSPAIDTGVQVNARPAPNKPGNYLINPN